MSIPAASVTQYFGFLISFPPYGGMNRIRFYGYNLSPAPRQDTPCYSDKGNNCFLINFFLASKKKQKLAEVPKSYFATA
jgi:hypothetical protein